MPELRDVDTTSRTTDSRRAWSSTATPRRASASPRRISTSAVRRLRPASGLHHVHRAEPVPRGHGSRSEIPARIPMRSTTSTSSHPNGTQVPLSAISHFETAAQRSPSIIGPVPIHHALIQSRARTSHSARRSRRIERVKQQMGMPSSVQAASPAPHRPFSRRSPPNPCSSSPPWVTVYIVLGILYESTFIPSRFFPRCRQRA